MIRLHFVVEGQTEETFINRVLSYHLGQHDITVDARRVETGRRQMRVYRGGLDRSRGYHQARRDLEHWMNEDRNPDAYFTTMFDLYALPPDFPDYHKSRHCASPYERVTILEKAFERKMEHARFIAYIQLHEFEALLLSDPARFDWEFLQHERAIQNLSQMVGMFDSPELFNDDPNGAPSKRIIRVIPEYAGRKLSAGPLIAEKIGIPAIRTRCPHFDAWLTKLESLP